MSESERPAPVEKEPAEKQHQWRDLPSAAIRQHAFLVAFVETCGCIEKAAALSGIPKENHYRWKREDPGYPAMLEAAMQAANDNLESEIIRRGVAGIDKPVFYKGQQVSTVREFSDTLLMFLTKARMPEKYREQVETKVSGTVKHEHEHSGTVSVEQRRASLLGIVHSIRERNGAIEDRSPVDGQRQVDSDAGRLPPPAAD